MLSSGCGDYLLTWRSTAVINGVFPEEADKKDEEAHDGDAHDAKAQDGKVEKEELLDKDNKQNEEAKAGEKASETAKNVVVLDVSFPATDLQEVVFDFT